jgi:hypothetical protein
LEWLNYFSATVKDQLDVPNGYQQFLPVSVVDLSYKHKSSLAGPRKNNKGP